MTDTITKVELAKWFSDEHMPDTGRAKLFGELVIRATPIIENYHGDLFHDAVWISRNIYKDGDWFYWTVDDYGTHLGQEQGLLEHRKKAQYRVAIHREEQVWYAYFQDITPE